MNTKPKTSSTIHFIFTGGTIDSFYDGTKDTVIPLKKSAIPGFVRSLKLYEKSVFSTVCMKDSRMLRKKDLLSILKIIKNSPHQKFIITHGTYTMPDTSRFLEANLGKHSKKIILTGSMIPLIGFAPSDAPFNLGFSIASLNHMVEGIKVCMNGKLFSPGEVAKLLSAGRFISVFNK